MKSRWSQNFLIDRNIARKCVEALQLGKEETVLEIGPGKGMLTELLLQKAKRVVAVEIDSSLCETLKKVFNSYKNLSLVNEDFLDFDFSKHPWLRKKKFTVIGNLPYAVVSPILQKLCSSNQWRRAVLMVQKEVGERILAKPGGRTYGVLSISVQSWCNVEKICQVSRNCFKPVPKVDSMVLRLFPLEKPCFHPLKEKKFFEVVKGCFAHRRKTILNSMALSLKQSSAAIETAIQKSGLSCQVRAETLSIEDFVQLCKNLSP